MATMNKKHDLPALEALYSEAVTCDQDDFAEKRTSLLLIAGEHYTKKNSLFYKRIRDTEGLSEQQKLRLTKNHTQKIVKTYVNDVLATAPGVGFMPKNESELQDQKAAELHHAVWLDGKEKYGLDERIDEWGDDFMGLGEVAVKIFWDRNAGKIKSYQQKTNPSGEPLFLDENGNETPENTGNLAKGAPIYEGGFVFERIYGFNLLRDPAAKDMRESSHLTIQKMLPLDDLKSRYPNLAEKLVATADRTMTVFDGVKANYRKSRNEVLVKETYFRPCPLYPRGYFFFFCEAGILEEGELPGGIYPIVWQYCEKIQTSPRGFGPVRTIRPYQAEINRAASKIAEHHITLGDDKLLIQNGTKISAGVALPGVRSINYTGMTPEVLEGRSGSQYLEYMNSQITELYSVMNVQEGDEGKQIDPYLLLFRSARQKKKFQRYIRRFENFLINVAKTYVALCKIYLPDDAVIYAVGRKEQVNIPEFRNAPDINYQIKVEAQADDIELKLGKQLMINTALQYVGSKLEREDIGKLMRMSPYADFEESFSDLTLEYDTATNDILALDRGEMPPISPYDNHVYMVKRLVARIRQADFKFLDPMIQQNYVTKVQLHMKAEAQRQQEIQRAKDGFIPTGGYLVGVDFYVNDPASPGKTRRARLPYESVQWLIKQLEVQGQSLDQLEMMNQGALAEMSRMVAPGGSPAGQVSQLPRPAFNVADRGMNNGTPNAPERAAFNP